MAKKHTRNQSTSLSTCFVSRSKESSEKISNQRQETCTSTVEDTYLTYSRANQLSSSPFQFVKTRVEDSSGSLPRQFQTTTSAGKPACQYHYYQTNSSRWMNQTEYKHQNINCWLENVLKNNQNKGEENEGFETDHITLDRDQDYPTTDYTSTSCFPRAKRYKPYQTCVKREPPIIDQNEKNCRQEKIRTLTTLITRHDEHLNGLKLCKNMDGYKERSSNMKKFRGPERGKISQIQQNQSKSKTNGKSTKEKKTSFDIRNPNSIFLAVLEEEQIVARGRSTGGWCCCATETLSGQQDELHVELENISAS